MLLCWILALHVPALFAFGLWRGYGLGHSALEVAPAAATLLFARLARQRRLAAFFATAGLVFCSYVLVHLSGGTIEAHFHFFILIGLIALYQDWVPFLWNVVFTTLSHGIGTVIDPNAIFNHTAAQNRPWSWAAIHGVAVLAGSVGVVIFWKNTEHEQQRAARLATELAEAELAAARREAAQRQSVSELFVNLARRNQSLLDRQLALIGDLEQRERSPEALAELFRLDHLATRIRRNAESLLVLSGDDPPRRWGHPVPLGEVVRAAAAEVEDYARVEVLVDEHLEVAGRAVADLAHLLAELIENATSFSRPSSEVRVRSHLVPSESSTFLLSVEDTGIGMSADEMRAANELLAEPPEVDLRRSRLGFHVVSRLAKRYRIQVRLADTPGGGVTALVTLPNDLVHVRRETTEPAGALVGARSGGAAGAPGGAGARVAGTAVPGGDGPTGGAAGGPGSPGDDGDDGASAGAGAGDAPSDGPGDAATDPPGPPMWTTLAGADADDPSAGPTVWTVPDADTLARLVTPARKTERGRDRVFPPPVVVDARRRPGAPPPDGRRAGEGADPGAGGDGSVGSGSPSGPSGPDDGRDGGEKASGNGDGDAAVPGRGGDRPPAAPDPPVTAEGLVKRVPGAGLPPALRRPPVGERSEGTGVREAGPLRPAARDNDRVRSMLSRFQASQRAGRAAAAGSPPDPHRPEDEA
ncbi:MAG TPA: ATP-binding protein [Acidimicrobiales bacterium]